MDNQNTVSIIVINDIKKNGLASIDNAHDAFQAEVRSLGVQYAAHNLPEKSALSIEPLIETIRATYERIHNDHSLELAAGIRTELAELDIHTVHQNLKELKIKANTFRNQVDSLREAKKKYVGKRTKKDIDKLNTILTGFTIVETLGYILSFIQMGDSILLSIAWGLLIGVGIAVFIRSLVLFLRDGAGAKLPKVVKYLITLLVFAIATGLGLLRYFSVKSDPANAFGQSVYSPIIFILLSYFIITGIGLYVYHYFPTNEELEEIKKAKAAEDDASTRELELIECEDQIKRCNEKLNLFAQVHALMIQAAKDFYIRVNSHFKFSVGNFKNINRITRTDNITPDCFTLPVADLGLPNYDAWATTELDTKNTITNP